METIELLADNQVVRINVPLIGRRTLSLDCIPERVENGFFDVSFFPDQLPAEELDLEGQCTLSFDVSDMVYIVRARIDSLSASGKLRLINVESFSSGQKREYFRIDTELSLLYRPVDQDEEHAAEKTRVNLSGGGIRFPASTHLRLRDKIMVKLCFGDLTEIDAECVGQVVRIDEKRGGHMEVAVAFLDISPKDRDKIISYCFARQREQLRKRVRVKDDRHGAG
ncbi:PilZ domain-containing protein [Geothermobacter ehrlichii]|uniref:PilZ domain-containing protein n=1 Tax=Geothermobacter ehrlichii TaxID=213224 RepID=A0A5D3WRE5_9BACT|nr:PilZ domain-containing protein [Geothermobacter ehrlichii]TYP00169.1 PilZ domain-containing protein [Geothermobacter ehrlichii]